MFLISKYLCRMDEKGRITIPFRLRKKLKGKVIITFSPDGCLTLSPIKKDGIKIDKQGRVVVSPALKKYAGLKDDVVVVGCLRYIEIWDRGIWEELEKEFCEIQRKVFS